MSETSDPSTRRALAALDAMAAEWAEKVNLPDMATTISIRTVNRATAIEALVKQAFVEGAYQCYCDAKDGKIPWMKIIQ